MTLPGFANRCALIAAATCVAVLIGWWLVWPLMRGASPPQALLVLPLMALGILLAAAALAASTAEKPALARACAGVLLLLGLSLLAEAWLGWEAGPSQWFSPQIPPGGIAVLWQPGPQAALSLLLIAAALLLRSDARRDKLDAGDCSAAAAVLLPFVLLLGHVFGADELVQTADTPGAGLSAMSALLLLLLAAGTLSLDPQRGLMAAYTAPTAGGAASRRLVPWVILLPVLLGSVQMTVLREAWLPPALTLALGTSASILAFLGLIHWISALLTRLEARQQGEHQLREAKAKEEGMTDQLTGLLNRRGWEQQMELHEALCQEQGRNACIVMIDLDDLKKVNDSEGHDKGDELIIRAGQALRGMARQNDILARLGGDEFAYLAVGCLPDHAQTVLKRLAQALYNAKVQASLGHASRDLSGSLKATFKDADQAMYANKKTRKAHKARMAQV